MNKKLLLAFIGLVIVLAFIVYLVIDSGKSEPAKNNTETTDSNLTSYKTVGDACKLFTLDDAKQVIGDTAKADTAVSQTADSGDVVVTACTYSSSGASQIIQTASLIVRSPKTSAGAISNQTPFNSAKPKNAQSVSGLGEQAYWDPELAQLNINAQSNWLIITAGPTKASDRTQQQAVQSANKILPRI